MKTKYLLIQFHMSYLLKLYRNTFICAIDFEHPMIEWWDGIELPMNLKVEISKSIYNKSKTTVAPQSTDKAAQNVL